MKILKPALAGLGLIAAIALPVHGASAADWPVKPITMVVPFPAGGATDIVGRLLAKQLGERLGQSVIVENKGGANATIGMQYVANSAPDGYTILYNTSSLTLSPALYKKLSFNPAKSFDAVSTTATVPLVLLVSNDVPANTIEEFVQHAKSNPGTLNFASSGNGNITHLAGFLFNQGVGISAEHIPYKGTAPALVDLIGGRTDYMMGTLSDALPMIAAKKVKMLAVTTLDRVQNFPDLPTVDETVLKGFNLSAWQGVVTPAGVPEEVLAKLNAAVLASMKSEEMVRQLGEQGTVILGSTRDEYAQFIDSQLLYWNKAVEDAGVERE